MSDLLGNEQTTNGTDGTEQTTNGTDRPSWLPENFKQPEDLVKSYNELRGKLRDKLEAPDKYALPDKISYQPPEALLASLKDAGLPQAQAAAVLQAIDSTFLPELQKQAQAVELNALAQQWGTDPADAAFQDRKAQIAAWAKENMPEEVRLALSSSAKGVLAIERQMQAAAKDQQTTGTNSDGAVRLTQLDVNNMVADPRYGHDMAYTDWVQQRVSAATQNGPLR